MWAPADVMRDHHFPSFVKSPEEDSDSKLILLNLGLNPNYGQKI